MQDPQSQSEIDTLIAAFFAAFDNRDGRVPKEDEVTRSFSEMAAITVHRDDRSEVLSPIEFAEPRISLLTSGVLVDFHEWEDSSSTEIVRAIAVRRSRYSKNGTHNGAPYSGSGTKFFQLARFSDGWRIVALSWIDDAE